MLSRHKDVACAAQQHELFSSESGGARVGGGTTLEDLAVGVGPGSLLNMMDPPRHDRIRALVNKGFKPSTLATLEAPLRERTRAILAAAAELERCDFLREVAAELPLQAISGLLGNPEQDRHQLFEWAMDIVDYSDRQLGESSARLARAAGNLIAYGKELVEAKRRRPADDMLSLVVHAEIPGESGTPERLGESEVLSFFLLLIIAGSETTRNAIAGGAIAFLQNPEQWAALRAQPQQMRGAVEEILRWSSPTAYNRRTATRDCELGGQRLRAGDKVSLWWSSANRDEEVFAEPDRFDIARKPNPHLAFGQGIHHCLGAGLARLEIRLVFEELLANYRGFEAAGPVEWARSNKHTGIRHLPLRLLR